MKKKSGRRILSLLMAVILLIGTLHVPGLTLKVRAESSGSCGPNATWSLDDNGVLTLGGTGSVTTAPWNPNAVKKVVLGKDITDAQMGDLTSFRYIESYEVENGNTVYSSEAGVLFDENKETILAYPRQKAGESYNIPNSVTAIGRHAFGGSAFLHELSIPEGVTVIREWAFYAASITSVTLPESLTTIENQAFRNCTGLTTVNIPKNVTSIWGNIFYNCSALESISVDNNNANYSAEGGVLFDRNKTRLICYPCAKNLTDYSIPGSVTNISDSAFYECEKLESVTIPAGVTEIEYSAFAYCSKLNSINIPAGLTMIGNGLFMNCTSLTDIVIPEGVTDINPMAFGDCEKLKSVTIPKSVSRIKEDAFSGCDSLTDIIYNGNENDWKKIDLSYVGNAWNSYNITYNDVSVVAQGTCGDNLSWELDADGILTISGTGAVTSHPWNDTDIIGDHRVTKAVIGSGVTDLTDAGFESCPWLEEISVDKANTEYTSEDGILFNKNKTEIIQYPCNKEGDEYTVPDRVTVIGDYAFVGCSNLTGISLPDGVTTIGTGAFSKCSELADINIPDSVTDMKAAAFFRCTSIEDISIPEGVKAVKNRTFAGCSKLKSITFSDSVTSIEEDAFNNCSSLTDVYYGGAGTKWNTLQSNIAANNSSLTNAKIHYMKGSCGSNAAWTLTKDGVLTISGIGETEWTAGECWKPEDVKKLIIEEGINAIGDEQFSDCQKLTEAEIAGSVTEIGDWSFYCCYELTDIVIPENVTSVGEGAFAECILLKNVTIPVTVSKIEADAFSGCTSLSDVYYGGTEEDWNKIAIDGNGNDLLIGANIHYMVFVTGVSVTPTTLELRVGESGTLIATITPENVTNKNVNWTSSKPEVATVADGVVTAVAEGESIITVTTADGEKTATCKVTVAGIPVTGVSIAPETLSLKIGGTGTLAATVSPENATNKKVSWTSSTPEVATIADGVVTAVAEGESIITVTTEDGAKKATCKVTVSSKDINVSEVSITPETLSLKIGESGTLTATVSPENATNKKLNWTSSAEAVATVADGVVTAVAAGESIITVTSEDGGKTATCKVTVTKAEEVVDPEDPEKTSEPKIPEGPLGPEKPDLSRYTASGNEMAVKSINLKKTLFKDVKGIKKFNVTAGDASAVKIKGSTLMVLQDATVTIEAFDKKKEKLAEKTVTVIAPAIDSAQTTEINRRGTLDLNKYILSTLQPSGWKSSNKKIAEVGENGLLVIKKSGTVKLTATFPAEKGMTAKKLTIKLKVKMPQFKKTTYTVKTGKTIKTAVKNADEAGITYRTEDTAIATVDATGNVTGVSKGTTKLIMTVKGIDYETKIKVK